MNSTRWTLAIAAAVALALFTVLVAIPFLTTTLSDGVQSYSQGDYPKAYKQLKPLAEDSEPTAQYILGEMFRLGQGVKKTKPRQSNGTKGPPRAVHPKANLLWACVTQPVSARTSI